MPQANERLRKKFNDDQAAFRVLGTNYRADRGGVIHRVDKTRKPTRVEEDALDYLFYEWDYCYEPRP